MPFGLCGERSCANPDCRGNFHKKTPWQRHCSLTCRNRHTYLRTVLPRRRRAAAKGVK